MFKILLSVLFIANVAIGATVARKPTQQELDKTILLTENNHVLLRGPVTDESVSTTISKLSEVLNKRRNLSYPIYLVLDTPGGSVDAGFRLYEFLRTYNNVSTITLGSYSMGAVLVEMLPGERLMTETAVLMFHRMAVAFPNHIHIDQIHARIRFFQAQEEMVIKKIALRTGMELNALHKLIDEDLYLSAEQALEKNFIDRIVPVRCSKQLLKAKVTEIVSGGGFLPDIPVERSACPLSL